MGIINRLLRRFGRSQSNAMLTGEEAHGITSEIGMRPTPERQQRLEYSWETIDYDYRAVVLDIRRMDREDGRVKRIHNRVARDVTRGGLVLLQADPSARVQQAWREFVRRLQLDNAQKLKSDARGLVMEGNLPMQWVLDNKGQVVAAVRMPADLNVLQLVQTLTDFSAQQTTQIPFEERDLAPVYNDGMVFEGQPIPFAGVSQKMDLAYINQMKLALSVTNEVVHFTRASVINWDALGRNIETNARILRELVARRLINEIQRASDSYAAVAITDESVTPNATSGIFKTAKFPVVRPHQNLTLQGAAVGEAENPITIKIGATVVKAYDGTNAQPAGEYFRIVDLNQGIFQLVNQLGAPKAGATGVKISYSQATNIVLFNLDVASGNTLEKHLNGLLREVGAANPPRPSVNYEIKLQAAFEFLQAHPDIEPERVNQHSIEHMADDIAMHSTISSDGYELAKELDTRAGWENIDMDLVETLDSYSMYLHHRLERAKKQWAEENNIQPPYPVGGRVRSLLQWNNITGTITGISPHHAACYEVKKDGTAPDDTTRRIIEFEAVELLEGETK